MDTRIQNRIEQVAARFRHLRFLWMTAAVLMAAAVVTLVFWMIGVDLWFGGWQSVLLVLGGAA